VAADVSQRAARVLELGGVTTVTGREAVQAFDKSLRDSANTANPGTSADLTTAAIFALLVSEQLPSSLAPVGHPP
jgi:triphosphoribosyl-dephospho-CoA synthetase